MQISTPSGIVTLEAKWLMPAGTMPADVAKDPKSCHVGVMIELREHAIARAARVLRESGATPTQVKVGIQLALGKTKSEIAGELGIKPTSVMDLARKLYQTLDVHNSSELATRIWLGERRHDERGYRMSGAQALIANGASPACGGPPPVKAHHP
ncbi:MAG: LuxR C-terminal-related transcriptional regulator [Beijerinckiaceae bacterium]|nr:LuxR C-terminal-related transcriptional regulator [Beijerinckiaceae bacterium]